ncbi:MAG: acyl-CoA dehydrogenase family protein [Velocimicrobium sp.]
MEFKLTEDQIELKKDLIQFVRNEINGDVHTFKEKWKLCADYGLFGISFDEKYGGLGESFITSALLMEALGYSCDDNGFVFVITNHLWACMNVINQCCYEELKQKYLTRLIDGSLIGSLAITEDESGSDIASIKTRATKVENGYLLNGSKAFISNAPIADVFVVSARTGAPGTMNGISCFVVERNTSGLEIGRDIEKMGLKSCPMGELNFNDCFIPEENLVGKVGNGLSIINSAMDWERCFEFASNIGVMQKLMEMCTTYTEKRKLNQYQAVTHKIAKMRVNIEMSQLLLYKIAWQKDMHKNTYLEASMFKYFVSETYVQACLETLQIFGAYGYSIESNIEKEVRDALASKIYSGASEIQLNIIYKLVDNAIKANLK